MVSVEPTRVVSVQVYGSLLQLPGVAVVGGGETVAGAHLPKGSAPYGKSALRGCSAIFDLAVPGAVGITQRLARGAKYPIGGRGDGCRPKPPAGEAPFGGAPLRSA